MKKLARAVCLLAAAVVTATAAIGLGGCANKGGKGKNTDKSFSMVASWTSSGLVNHYDSNTSCNVFEIFVVEGLYRYVRSTDEVYCQVAGELPVNTKKPMSEYKDVMGEDAYNYFAGQNAATVTVSTVKIRDNAKWQNGESVVAKDIWAYYYMIHPTSSNYMAAVKAVDDKTVEFVWNPLKEPNDSVKLLLLAQDKSCTVKYDVFASYVDTVFDVVMKSPVNTDLSKWGAFNRFSTNDQIVTMNRARNAFYAFSPSWYIATGPFKLQTFSATQLLLVKNPYYWNADNIGFERIKLYSSSDLNQTYQLITGGYIDYYDGFIQQDTLNSMLASNSDLVNLKMFDPGSIGIVFNLENKLFTQPVREAFQYIFNREEIKMAANPYAQTSYYPLLGMAASEAETYMSKEHFDAIKKYEYNTAKAEELLKAAGWTKSGGKWSANGKEVKLRLGAPSTSDIASMSAEAAAAQLEAFGIGVDLLKSSNFYSNAVADNSQYDLMCEWTDLNMSFSYPTGSYNQFANIYSEWAHVERYPTDENLPDYNSQKAGGVKLIFDGLDGDTEKYEFADYINSFYSVDEKDLTYLVDVFNTGLSKLCLGVQFFQNVTAATYNVGRIDGIPFEDKWKNERNLTYVPEAGTEDFFTMARVNLVFSCNHQLAYGVYQPKS